RDIAALGGTGEVELASQGEEIADLLHLHRGHPRYRAALMAAVDDGRFDQPSRSVTERALQRLQGFVAERSSANAFPRARALGARRSLLGEGLGSCDLARDEPRAALERQVAPEPVQGDRDAVAETDQEIDVGGAPDEPADKAG